MILSGHAGDAGVQPTTLREMKHYSEDLQKSNSVSFPSHLTETMVMLEEVENSMTRSHVRIRVSMPIVLVA
jgi:hypothetical protein